MADSWRSKEAFQHLGLRRRRSEPVRAGRVLPPSSPGLRTSPSKEDPMKRHAILAGIAGTMLVAGFAGAALAEGKYYPDGTNCSLLSDAELVACQNQIYARQLSSGESDMATGPNDQT